MAALRFWLAGVGALLFLGDPGLGLPSSTEGPPALGNSSSHSIHYFYTGVSEPNQGLPRYIAVGYVDGQVFYQYDSNTQRMQPRAPWIKKVDKDDPEYWERNTRVERHNELWFRDNLNTLKNRYQQNGGFHVLQIMYGCELRTDGSIGWYRQYAYDGKDYMSLDKETLTWTAVDPTAQITQRKWNGIPAIAQDWEAYLEGECIDELKRFLEYGKKTLLRTEPPVGKVTRTVLSKGREMLICQAYGFYPKDIEATWRKGKEVMEEETFRRNVALNSDGTFHAWLSIEINPEERELYRCHIEHAGLREPLVLAWEAPGAKVGSIIGIVLGILAALLLVAAAIVFFLRKRQRKKKQITAQPQVGALILPSLKLNLNEVEK